MSITFTTSVESKKKFIIRGIGGFITHILLDILSAILINLSFIKYFLKLERSFYSFTVFGNYYFLFLNKKAKSGILLIPGFEYDQSKIFVDSNIAYEEISRTKISKNQDVYFLFMDEKNIAFLGYSNETLSISGSENNFDFSIPINSIRIEANHKGDNIVNVDLILQKKFGNWDAIEFFIAVKECISSQLLRVSMSFESKKVLCSLLFSFGNNLKTNDIHSILKYCCSILENVFIKTEEYLNTNIGYKLFMPEYLKIPIIQYFNFFDEYIFKTKGVKASFRLKKVDDGLLISIPPEKAHDLNNIENWTREYLQLIELKTISDKELFSDYLISSDKELLIEKLQHQIAFFKKSIEIIYKQSNFLNSTNNLSDNFVFFSKDEVSIKEFKIKEKLILDKIRLLIEQGNTPEAIKKIILLDIYRKRTLIHSYSLVYLSNDIKAKFIEAP